MQTTRPLKKQSLSPFPALSKTVLPALIAALTIGVSNCATASVEFEFDDGEDLDAQGVGASISENDSITGDSVRLTTVEIQGQDGTLASTGAMHLTNSLADSDALGIDSANDPNTNWANDDRDFNPGEAWTFSFNEDVALIEIDFAGWGDTSSEVTLTFSDGTPAVVMSGDQPGDTFTVNTFVTSGTEVTMALTNTSGDQEVRLKSILLNLPQEGIMFDDIDGGQWTTTEADFVEGGLPKVFEDGDDVIFPNSGNIAVTLEAAGIMAGDITWANIRNGRLRFLGGDLICEDLTNLDRGSVAIANTTMVTGVATFEENGELEIWDGGSLTFAALTLSGDSLFELREGGTYNNPDGVITLGDGGADIRNHIDMTIGSVANTIDENPLEISGDGNLTFAAGMGTETTGPVNLNVVAGSVTLAGTEQINIGGSHTLNGSLVMAGPTLELHGSLISGTGSISVAASSLMSPRFNGSLNLISVPVEIAAGQVLSVDPALANNAITFNDGLTGDGGFTKLANGLCVITASASGYAGDTNVEAGTLRFDSSVLSNTGSVSVSGNGKLDLRHGSGDAVRSLFIDGVQMNAGTYGSSSVTGVTLDVINNDHFSSNGWLIVLNDPPANDYEAWATGFALVGGPDDDEDNDGVSNRAEYAFGLDPSDSSSANPLPSPLNTNGVFSYTRRNPITFSTGLRYRFEYSSDLQNWLNGSSFTTIGQSRAPIETVQVTIPSALLSESQIFVRVIAF